MRVEAGLVIGNRFRLLSLVGAGPFGSLWRAADRIPGKQVAIRIVGDLKLGAAALDAFRREMLAATAVHHPSLARIYAAGSDSHGAWVARELVEGHPLATVLEREVLSQSEALDIVAELAGALAEIHALGLAHGAVSPRTVLVRRSKNDVFKPRLIGLGRAQLLRSTQPAYTSPEVLASPHYGAPSDIWSLGVLLYRCVNGRLPFAARPAAAMELEARRVNRVLSTIEDPRIRLLVADCFALHPDARPNASEVARRARSLAREIERERTLRAWRPTDPPESTPISSRPTPVALMLPKATSTPPLARPTTSIPPPIPKRPVLELVATSDLELVESELFEPEIAEVVEAPAAPEPVAAPAPSSPAIAVSVDHDEDLAVDFRPKRARATWVVSALAAAAIVAGSIGARRASSTPAPVAAQAMEPLRIPEAPIVVTPPAATPAPTTTEVAASASVVQPAKVRPIPAPIVTSKPAPRRVTAPPRSAGDENPYE
jgi:serine/threonine-protein kinase